ncbi:MAG: prephenate dehydratase domain-containing protein [Bacillota bacterium]|nr:prephenate dehydratase domain-containing protein [Bacillota bacterium]
MDNCIKNKIVKDKKIVKKVSYQGLPFSYSEITSKTLFNNAALVNKESFEDVFKDVHEGNTDIGVVPIENTKAGYVNEVYDLLLKYNLYINYGYIKKIDHCLAGTPDSKLEDIREVHSHPQALMQCREYLKNNNLKIVNEVNTAVAAKKINDRKDNTIACLCSVEAAKYYGLKILKEKLNPKENYTRFGAISKDLLAEKNHNRISILFKVPHEAGALNEVISLFAKNNLSLSSIYSRPDMNSPWKYLFYLDFDGNILDNSILSMLNKLKEELPYLKILGSYKI